ncbi:DUF4269 domain-containing protein [Paenibacillus sambharensis]|uniref:DUF4269 domain-containing protein n=1 Tax=Paenibacillus sambharensis TaxID=1803190 RepID=A0A2W1LAP3_9BACL|nr:DUF4269 domain-containing protein [Paenibacillus sambharensis]PZD97318.1 DUF4269 domain-containing protein [Paenibacillus sambharensis]
MNNSKNRYYIDYTSLEYLKNGSHEQAEVYELLVQLNIFEQLRNYNPILAGTVPIGINLPSSDLDIICEVYEPETFAKVVSQLYGEEEGFSVRSRTVNGTHRVVSSFVCNNWTIELFGQPIPSSRQNAYRHMVIEARILSILENSARNRIIELKRNGLKTEPAFARLLDISGDPYQALLDMYDWDDGKLRDFLRKLNQ